MYALLEPGVSESFVSPYIVVNFRVSHTDFLDPFTISTLVGEFVIGRKLYQSCHIFVHHKDTTLDIEELNMINFDGILVMYSLCSCYL